MSSQFTDKLWTRTDDLRIDLDGDTYQLITISSLIPKTPAQPRSHTAMGPMRLEKSGGIDDVSRTFAMYLELDTGESPSDSVPRRELMTLTVGLIATTHLRVADGALKGGHDPRCEALADLYSSAVDFVKTGSFPSLLPHNRTNDPVQAME